VSGGTEASVTDLAVIAGPYPPELLLHVLERLEDGGVQDATREPFVATGLTRPSSEATQAWRDLLDEDR